MVLVELWDVHVQHHLLGLAFFLFLLAQAVKLVDRSSVLNQQTNLIGKQRNQTIRHITRIESTISHSFIHSIRRTRNSSVFCSFSIWSLRTKLVTSSLRSCWILASKSLSSSSPKFSLASWSRMLASENQRSGETRVVYLASRELSERWYSASSRSSIWPSKSSNRHFMFSALSCSARMLWNRTIFSSSPGNVS